MFVFFNPNPDAKRVGDCTVRAIAKAMNTVWDKTYLALCVEGLRVHDMPSANSVWGSYLKANGFKQHALPDTCPECYTVAAFADEHTQGTYVLTLSARPDKPVQGAFSRCIRREHSDTNRRHGRGNNRRYRHKRRAAYRCDGDCDTGCCGKLFQHLCCGKCECPA